MDEQINEPPTPFSYGNVEDEHNVETDHPNKKESQQDVSHNWEALNAKLHYEASQQQEKADRAAIGESGNDEVSNDHERFLSFEEHRAAHYNEFLVLKAMREKMDMDELEDEACDDGT